MVGPGIGPTLDAGRPHRQGTLRPTTVAGVFGRRDKTATATPENSSVATRGGGKGRATPSRRTAEQARRERVRPSLTRREAARRQREDSRKQRLTSRQALMSGDERALPRRDQGPVRARVRDLVDSRRTVGEFFLPLALLVLLTNLITPLRGISVLLWLTMMAALVVDSFLLLRRVRRDLGRRFPEESHRGTTGYTLLRSTQMRRLRLPPPRVKPGAKV